MTIILKAAPVVEQNTERLKLECKKLKEQGITPSMKVVLVGENPASLLYTRNKKKFIEKLGAECEIIKLSETIDVAFFVAQVEKIAADPKVHGCFVQLPLPKQLKGVKVGQLIPPSKDVDGFHYENLAKLFTGDKGTKALLPCTPKGIIKLLEFYNIQPSGKHVVVLGRSLIVGRPMAALLTNYDATVTLCHSKTKNLSEITKTADIIICAVGNPKGINTSFVDQGKKQIIIDVGINRDPQGKLCGDCDYDAIRDQVAGVTPVPGGVGPMTILSLADNLIIAAKRSLKK